MQDTEVSAAEITTLASAAEDLIALEAEADAAESAAKLLRDKANRARASMAQRMADEETQNFKTAKGVTIYLARKLHVSKGKGCETEQLVEALDALSLNDFARRQVIYPSLKSWVREQDEKHQSEHPGASPGEALPPQLKKLLNIYEETTVGILGRSK